MAGERAAHPQSPGSSRGGGGAQPGRRAGGVLIAPLMPGINDGPTQVERILALAGEAGAVSVGGLALHLRGDVRGIFFDWLALLPAGARSAL